MHKNFESTADSADLLDWYDRHARVMPWRVAPEDRAAGIRPDPYRVWLSEVMLQQTTVAAVKDYFRAFTDRWPTVSDLAAAEDAEVMGAWAGLGYYARARNLLKCARVVASKHGGVFPDTAEGLRALPGIGPYTAAAVSAIAFDRAETVVDGNVERVMARLHGIETPLPPAKPELTEAAAALTPQARPGDYAQAVMDLGATICTPRNPACGICPWREPCAARAAGNAAELPRKLPKKPKPTRLGYVYIARRGDGAWLLETRPNKGLLGGMLAFPSSDWTEESPAEAPPLSADWADPGLEVRHTFTHFHLRLAIRLAQVGTAPPSRGEFTPKHAFRPADLPTLMRKAYDLAAPQFELTEP
ncbi:A/G-specific adenine glycosylase [Dinoroseobacter sp. S124A]|uniref:A/G-specific adenine glycosylase n=1 Tax=Dinoroseobacter sp. S124A TaxID=3415128 RepID=UPI003C7B542E